MYDLHRLRLLRELKARGTLAAVAKALSYSPSSVSQQLSQLEAEVGVPLLEHVGRGVRLTAHAEILVEHTDAIMRRMELAQTDLARASVEVVGTLRIGAFQTAALAFVPEALTALRERHPRLRVHVVHIEAELVLPALLTREFDLVIAEEYPGNALPRPAGIERRELCRDPLRLALPPGSGPPRLSDLATRPWAMEPEGTVARLWAVTVCRNAGFEPDVRFESADVLFHVHIVEQGHAVALVPDLVWRSTTTSAVLRPMPGGPHLRTLFTAVRTGTESHPAITACRDALAAAVR
ncbi:LysR family transcriptional regulator [Allokutzneria sp. NRRL B-24872]|uniref:LysR family transcriptional regulator n=1 Tax=Allokutzneria sp. NRRL B-24872 TaxID=1137961 RepID=UPI000A3D510A|nr:LysR family transcriptional regulator [Allokutzneria sp. NRRL B-24872]